MKHILSSAVVTHPGDYTYRLISLVEAIQWLEDVTDLPCRARAQNLDRPHRVCPCFPGSPSARAWTVELCRTFPRKRTEP
ncbi:MAG: hypothetical protein WC565_04805 [Parcubacteria group bacterium]